MKILPVLCKTAKEHTLKVADILSQLLQLEDPQEHAIATNSLCDVIKIDPMSALKGFFKQASAGEDIVQEKCVKFLSQKFSTFGPTVLTKEVEDYIFSEIKKIVDVSQILHKDRISILISPNKSSCIDNFLSKKKWIGTDFLKYSKMSSFQKFYFLAHFYLKINI